MGKIITVLPSEIWDIVVNPYRRDFKGVILHHTAYINREDQGEFIELAHLNGERAGYPPFKHGMGYHCLVNPSGRTQVGKRWVYQLHGAHCLGKNRDYLGVALGGNFMIDEPTEPQLNGLVSLLFYIGVKRKYLHHEFSATACPGEKFPFDVIKERLILFKAIMRLRHQKISLIKRWPYFNNLKP